MVPAVATPPADMEWKTIPVVPIAVAPIAVPMIPHVAMGRIPAVAIASPVEIAVTVAVAVEITTVAAAASEITVSIKVPSVKIAPVKVATTPRQVAAIAVEATAVTVEGAAVMVAAQSSRQITAINVPVPVGPQSPRQIAAIKTAPAVKPALDVAAFPVAEKLLHLVLRRSSGAKFAAESIGSCLPTAKLLAAAKRARATILRAADRRASRPSSLKASRLAALETPDRTPGIATLTQRTTADGRPAAERLAAAIRGTAAERSHRLSAVAATNGRSATITATYGRSTATAAQRPSSATTATKGSRFTTAASTK